MSDITVVVPTLNRAIDLERCLKALAGQREHLHEVIVIDNGSTDSTQDVISEFEVRVLRDRSRNLSRLFNLGWRTAESDIVAYLNDDSEPSPDWARWITRTFKDYPAAAMVGGPTIDVKPRQIEALLKRCEGSTGLRAAVRIYNRLVTKGQLHEIGLLFDTGGYSIGAYHEQATRLQHAISVDQLTITNVAIKRDILANLDGFDEAFLFNHADGDFFARARKKNYLLIFHPRIVVAHHANPSGPVRNPRTLGKDSARFFLKSVRPRTLRDSTGWLFNVLAFNCFWIYKAVDSGSVSQLTGAVGFVQGLVEYIRKGH